MSNPYVEMIGGVLDGIGGVKLWHVALAITAQLTVLGLAAFGLWSLFA